MKNIFLLLILFIFPAQGMEVTFYNIGQGNCTLVTVPGQKTMLVDAGSSKAPANDAHCNTVVSEIINKIKAKAPDKQLFIIASHADRDHINKMIKICDPLLEDKFSIEFLLGGTPSFYEKEDGKELIDFLKKQKKNCKTTFASDITGNDRAKQFSKLLPSYCKVLAAIISSGNNKLDPNDTSIIIKVSDGARSVLLPGDATGNVTGPLMRTKPISLLSTVYELSHHGAETHNCTTLPLLLAINPKTIIVSSGLFEGKLMHPRFESIKTAVEFCIKRSRINAQPHMLTYQDVKGVPVFNSKTDETRFNLVAINDDGFCTAQTSFPIYHTVDSGNITYNNQGITVSNANSTHEERGPGALQGIQTPRFNGIRFLFLNNMEIESAQLKENLTVLPDALEYMDLRNNIIGHSGIEHLITLYKNHGNDLIIKLADNCLVDKEVLTTICKKKDIKAITTKNRIVATFTKKGFAKDTVESLVLSRDTSGNLPLQHAQAKAYAQDSSVESEEALKNKLDTVTDDQEELVYEVSHDKKNLYIGPLSEEQAESYDWPNITDICLLSDPNQTVAGITTPHASTLFDFKANKLKQLTGRFRYTDPSKPWKTIGKEFWSLDMPGVNYYHERTPFSKNGKFVMTVSANNKSLNIYQIDPLVFDPRHVKLHKTIKESELKETFDHSISDIKRLAFTDNDHSVKLNFKDKTNSELRYILNPQEL